MSNEWICVIFLTLIPTIVLNQPVRLRDGSGPHEGRLEVYVDGQWGTVSDIIFGQLDEADVVCRQLGFSGLAFATTSAVFGQGSGPIAYSRLECISSLRHDNIGTCSKNPGYSTSLHLYDVGVVCNVTSPPPVRLIGGSGDHEGRLEILFRGQWGTICEPSLSAPYPLGPYYAKLVCRQLGFAEGSMVPLSSTDFGTGDLPIWSSELDYGQCLVPSNRFGREGSLYECIRQWGVGSYDSAKCDDHSHDLAIVCNASIPASDIRLIGGSGPHEGRLEVQHNGQWGSVCSIQLSYGSIPWPRAYSKVVCNQLGFSIGDSYETSVSVFGLGTGLTWEEVTFCSYPSESPCIYEVTKSISQACDLSHAIGIICNVTSPPPIRLVDGSNPNEGRVEINFNREWGTICNSSFGFNEGTAVCRQLGYNGLDSSWTATSATAFGNGQLQRIWLDGLCTESSARIDLCGSFSLDDTKCGYTGNASAAGVMCEASTPAAPIRLVGGSGPQEGRVEIFNDGEWGTICVEDYQAWGKAEADVVCRQLGYPPNDNVIYSLSTSQATAADVFGGFSQDKVWLDRVQCDSTREEYVLKECDHSVWGGSGVCDHSHDVGVVCGVSSRLSPLIRLVGGSGQHEGRLEIFFQGEWGTVCQGKDWEYDDLPETVCEQLGLSDGPSLLSTKFGPGEGRIWLGNVQCQGPYDKYESYNIVDDCQHSAWGGASCDHSMDIGVICDVIKTEKSSTWSAGLVVGIVLALIAIIIIILAIFFKKRYDLQRTGTSNENPMEVEKL